MICPDCGGAVTAEATRCPTCGRYFKVKKPLYTKAWFWIVVVLIFLFVVIPNVGDDSEQSDTTASNVSDSSNKSNTNSTTTNTDNKTSSKPTTSKPTANTSTPSTTIQQQVLLDQDGIKITAVEYVVEDILSDGIKVLIENNTTQNIRVSCNALIVNNYMIGDWFVSKIAAGKKVYDTIRLSSNELKASGITNVGQVEISFDIYDSDNYDDILDSEIITIKTSNYNKMDVVPNDSGLELYNANGIRIVGKYVDENSFWGSSVLLYMENNTDQKITISCENMSIDGFMIDGFLHTIIYPGKMAIDDITIFSSDLEENGIKSIEKIELSFHVINQDTYKTIFDTEPITFSVTK